MAYEIERTAYTAMFGPTVGDKVRLADTDLLIEVEEDKTTYGEEVKFGGGKVIRDGMGQSQASRAEGAAAAAAVGSAGQREDTGGVRGAPEPQERQEGADSGGHGRVE